MIGVRSLLATLSAAELAGVTLAIERAVERSFEVDRARVTGVEIRRRFDLCLCIFTHLRGDLGWGLLRILDRLPRYLRCELDGQPWAPDHRTCWMPADGL